MRFIYCFFFLIVLPGFAQKQPLDLKIDSVVSKDTISGERKYTITYHIENLTDREISCFLNPKRLLPAHYGSMGTSPLFKLYQNNDILDVGDILKNSLKTNTIQIPDFSLIKDEKERKMALTTFLKEKLHINTDSIDLKNTDSVESYLIARRPPSLMENIYTLKPKEIKTISQFFYWDKTRYYKQDEYEHYLDEKSVFSIELYLVLLRDQYKERLLPEEFEKITANQNFIQGVFTSNKMEIDFK